MGVREEMCRVVLSSYGTVVALKWQMWAVGVEGAEFRHEIPGRDPFGDVASAFLQFLR